MGTLFTTMRRLSTTGDTGDAEVETVMSSVFSVSPAVTS
jgi:hypothetical protein